MLAGLVGSFPVDASPPRTGAVVTAGGRTQAGALGAALVIVLLIPVANVLKDVPLATLAAVLIYVAIRLFKPDDLRAIARFDLFEFGLTSGDAALRGLHRGGAGHRRRGRAGHPRPDPTERPPPAARARAPPGNHQLGAPLR